MSTLFDRKVVCPICELPFSSKKIKRSAIAVERRDKDYCAYYKGDNPMYYGIFVCPSCGFASFETEFDGVRRLGNRFKENFRSVVAVHWKGQSFSGERDWHDAVETYKLALKTYNALDYKRGAIGKIFLRVAWLHRYRNNPKELVFLKYARDFFVEAYEKENFVESKEEELVTMLMVGEMSRRLKDYTTAIKWFDRLLKDPDVKKKRHIELRARDLWAETSSEYKALKNDQAM